MYCEASITCTPSQILLELRKESLCVARGIYYAWERREIRLEYLQVILKDRHYLVDLGVNERTVL
jgi:hypothetical protein